jgi:hypothetical protein
LKRWKYGDYNLNEFDATVMHFSHGNNRFDVISAVEDVVDLQEETFSLSVTFTFLSTGKNERN